MQTWLSLVEADGTEFQDLQELASLWGDISLELEEIGLAEFDIDARREATQRLTELMVDSQDMDRSLAEREWLERVLQRYIELIPTD